MKLSEAFEGENSSLRKAFDATTMPHNNNKEKQENKMLIRLNTVYKLDDPSGVSMKLTRPDERMLVTVMRKDIVMYQFLSLPIENT